MNIKYIGVYYQKRKKIKEAKEILIEFLELASDEVYANSLVYKV